MKSTYKVRISYQQVCRLLNISSVKLHDLILNDLSFPKPIQIGTASQSILFDYADIVHWYKNKRLLIQYVQQSKEA